jgi:acyl carrier protein
MTIASNNKLSKPKVTKKKETASTTTVPIIEAGVSVKKEKKVLKTARPEKVTTPTAKPKKIPSKLGLSKSFDPVIIEKLKAIISPYTEHPELLKKIEKETNVNFVEKLNIDSVDVVEIVVDVEQEFNITIEDKEIETFKTFEDMYNLIEAKIKEAKAA